MDMLMDMATDLNVAAGTFLPERGTLSSTRVERG